MLANMKAKIYCVHPGRLRIKVAGRDENGEPNGKLQWAWKHFGVDDIIKAYGVEKELCVTWGPNCVGLDHLIHLKPDPEGRYELPVMEPPERSRSKGKRKR